MQEGPQRKCSSRQNLERGQGEPGLFPQEEERQEEEVEQP